MNVGIALLDRVHEVGDLRWLMLLVAVHGDHPGVAVVFGTLQDFLHGATVATVAAVSDHLHAMTGQHGGCFVGASVIHHQHVARKVLHASQHPVDRGGLVEHGDRQQDG